MVEVALLDGAGRDELWTREREGQAPEPAAGVVAAAGEERVAVVAGRLEAEPFDE